MKQIMINIIKGYKKHFSIYFEKAGIRCKFYPTCSEYTKQAIKEYGPIKGTCAGIKRICRCNPFSKGGYDPVKSKRRS